MTATTDDWVQVRLATAADLADLTRWRQQPHVARWWHADGDPTPGRVREQYLPEIEGRTPTTLWIIEVNGRSVGFLQDYPLAAYPDYALLTPDPTAIGIDYAIGLPGWLGRGYGARAIKAWVSRCRERFPDAQAVFAAPDHRNAASLRVLEKAGFIAGTWFDDPDGSTVVGCTLRLDGH
ncbi:GNAT family N-acetyltransferase [Nocardioides sp. Bht2]|uniref:GNAT family N-acetyltransferase n=1 Tax=Nocardioides sp. Bht2 TaxID=3392297 RepID=UPI0039B400D8